RLVVGDSSRTVTWRQRPGSGGLPGLHVDHLNGVLPFVVDEDVSLSVCCGAFRRRILQFNGGDDVAVVRIDRGERSNRPAVIGEENLRVRLVVHDSVEVRAALDLFHESPTSTLAPTD